MMAKHCIKATYKLANNTSSSSSSVPGLSVGGVRVVVVVMLIILLMMRNHCRLYPNMSLDIVLKKSVSAFGNPYMPDVNPWSLG